MPHFLMQLHKESETVLEESEEEGSAGKEKGTVSTFLQSRIHESFTRAADQLYAMTFLTTEERIAISSCIGDALEAFSNVMQEKVPRASEIEVPMEVAQEILRNAIYHVRQGVVKVAQGEDLGVPIPSEYLDLPDRTQDHDTLRDLIELALINERSAVNEYDNILDVVYQMDLPLGTDVPSRKAFEEILTDEQDHEKVLLRMLGEETPLPVEASLVVQAKHSLEKCMRCDEPPTLECLWFNDYAHAWFCDKHFKEWVSEEHDRRNGSDVDELKEVIDGVASDGFKGWKANSNPDIKHKFWKIASLPKNEEEFLAELIAADIKEEFRFDPNSTQNEGRWQLIDPKVFDQGDIRRWNVWKEVHDPGVQFVMGVDTRDNQWKPQAVRFDTVGDTAWTEEAAGEWWLKNKQHFTKEWTQADWDEWISKHPSEVLPGYTDRKVQAALFNMVELKQTADELRSGVVPSTLAIDFDGTISEYDGFKGVGVFGRPIDGAKQILRQFKEDGWYIIIDTCRGEVPLIIEYLVMHDIPFDEVNSNKFQPGTANPGKPLADYRIDDSSIHFNGDWTAIYQEVYQREKDKQYSPLQAIKITSNSGGAFAYDPVKHILLDFINPFGHQALPTDYPDPAYWGYPKSLKKKQKERKKKQDEETVERKLFTREAISKRDFYNFYGALEAGDLLDEARRFDISYILAQQYLDKLMPIVSNMLTMAAVNMTEADLAALTDSVSPITAYRLREVAALKEQGGEGMWDAPLGEIPLEDVAVVYESIHDIDPSSVVSIPMSAADLPRAVAGLRSTMEGGSVEGMQQSIDYINSLVHDNAQVLTWMEDWLVYGVTLVSTGPYQPEAQQYMSEDVENALRKRALFYQGAELFDPYNREQFVLDFVGRLEELPMETPYEVLVGVDSPILEEELQRYFEQGGEVGAPALSLSDSYTSYVERGAEDDASVEYISATGSVLDYPRNALDATIWEYEEGANVPKLRPEVKETIIREFEEWADLVGIYTDPEEWIKEFLFIGSSATTQWKETSDIDVTVIVDEDAIVGSGIVPKDVAASDEVTSWLGIQVVLGLNGYEIGQHPVNYYIVSDEKPVDMADAVYSLITDTWIKPPPEVPQGFDPEEAFADIWAEARSWANKFDVGLSETRRDTQDYVDLYNYCKQEEARALRLDDPFWASIKMDGKRAEIGHDLRTIIDDFKCIYEQKEQAFSASSQAVPEGQLYFSRNWLPAVLVWKWLEKYQYLKLLKDLMQIYKEEPGDVVTEEKIWKLREVLS